MTNLEVNYNYLLDKIDIIPTVVFEIGAKNCLDTISISNLFPEAIIYSYECNPLMIDICKKKVLGKKNIIFNDFALGDKKEYKFFNIYAHNKNIDLNLIGASSFFQRPDINNLIKTNNKIKISTLEEEFNRYEINTIDILCMDTQGYELNILKGANHKLSLIKYIIMEEPKPLDEQIKNKNKNNINDINNYIDAPTYEEINNFMSNNNFKKICSIEENLFENNSLYKNNVF